MKDIERKKDLDAQIKVAAYFISRKGHTYDELCWELANRQLFIQNGKANIPKNEIKEKAEEIYHSFCKYEDLCWLIGELDVLIKNDYCNQ